MHTSEDPKGASSDEGIRSDPKYWANAFRGTPLAIVVLPYIRFMQGQISLRRALNFLVVAQREALAGNPRLQPILEGMNSSTEAKQADRSFETFFASTHVIALVSEVEHFFANTVSTALRLYPGKMGSHTFRLTEILAASSTDELVDRAASATINELMYEKPLDYLAGLCAILSIEKQSLEIHWPNFVELKARRDLGVHNDWLVNAVYLRKVKEARLEQAPLPGTRLIPDFQYLTQSIELCDTLVGAIANLLGEKWIPIATEIKRLNPGQDGDLQPGAA
jgi:hypothetical protein